MIRRLSVLAALLSAAVPVAEGGRAVAAEPIVLYAADNAPPFSYVENNRPVGIYVDIVREAAATLPGYDVTILPVPRRRGLHETTSGRGRALGFFPAYTGELTEEGEQVPVSAPLLTEETVVICTDQVFDAAPRHAWPQDYADLRVGRTAGTAIGGATESLNPHRILVEEGPNARANMQKLFRDRLDCVLTENLTFLLEMKGMERDGEYDGTKAPPFSVGTVLGQDRAVIAFRVGAATDPSATAFIRALDAALTAMAARYRTDEIVAGRLR